MTPEVWDTTEIAAYRDVSVSSVNAWLARRGIAPAGLRRTERGARNVYDANEIRQAVAAMPGKGNRTSRKDEHA